jgi:hypothetical protein
LQNILPKTRLKNKPFTQYFRAKVPLPLAGTAPKHVPHDVLVVGTKWIAAVKLIQEGFVFIVYESG